MTTQVGTDIEPKVETPETEYINFSDYLTLVKYRILSNNTLSDKFREYASIKLTIPTRKLIDIDYFNENNIDTSNMYQFHTTNVKHKDNSRIFDLTRGLLALYPDKDLSEESQLEEMNDRLNKMTSCNLHENKIQLDFLDTFLIASYIRKWQLYNREMELSSCLYYDTSTKELYASHTTKGVYLVRIEQCQLQIEFTLTYIINAFNRTIGYNEKYLLNEVLMIPTSGVNEALILNKYVLAGYKYNNKSVDANKEFNDLYKQVYDNVYLHYNNNMNDINIEGVKIYSDTLAEVCYDKYKVPGMFDMIDKMINICLEYDKSLAECLDEIINSSLDEKYDLLLIYMLANHPAYATHNFNSLYAKACYKGLDKVVRTLISFSKNSGNMLDHNYKKDYGFGWICTNDNLELAKYIYSLGNVNINEIVGGSPFNSACSLNQLELAKWLYTLEEVDIHTNKSMGFILSCSRNHEEVYRWMWEIATDKERYFEDWKESNIFVNKYDKYYKILH